MNYINYKAYRGAGNDVYDTYDGSDWIFDAQNNGNFVFQNGSVADFKDSDITTTGTGTFDYIEVNQNNDIDGFTVNGFDDQSANNLSFYVNNHGTGKIESNKNMLFESFGSGIFFRNAYYINFGDTGGMSRFGIGHPLTIDSSGNLSTTGTIDSALFQVNNDDDQNNRGRLLVELDGTQASIYTDTLGAGVEPTNLYIGEIESTSADQKLDNITFGFDNGVNFLQLRDSTNTANFNGNNITGVSNICYANGTGCYSLGSTGQIPYVNSAGDDLQYSNAIKYNSSAENVNIGGGSIINGTYISSLGYGNEIHGANSFGSAVGVYNTLKADYGPIAVGIFNENYGGLGSTAIGYNTIVNATYGVSIGIGRVDGVSGVAIGDGYAKGYESIAIGEQVTSHNSRGIALGHYIDNYGETSLAVGDDYEVNISDAFIAGFSRPNLIVTNDSMIVNVTNSLKVHNNSGWGTIEAGNYITHTPEFDRTKLDFYDRLDTKENLISEDNKVVKFPEETKQCYDTDYSRPEIRTVMEERIVFTNKPMEQPKREKVMVEVNKTFYPYKIYTECKEIATAGDINRIMIAEMKQEIHLLRDELCKKDGSYPWCKG